MEIQLSSSKHDNGLEELLSPDLNDFWHTDDNLPHCISIEFQRRTYVESVQIYCNYIKDDSYTPEIIQLWTGIVREQILYERDFELSNPDGYISLDVKKECHYLKLLIKQNHQEGRDSRIRHMKVFGEDGIQLFCNKR